MCYVLCDSALRPFQARGPKYSLYDFQQYSQKHIGRGQRERGILITPDNPNNPNNRSSQPC